MQYARVGSVILMAALLLAACATQPAPRVSDAPGFLLGLWHGLIVPFSLVASLFMDVRVYAFPNNGGWYDLGFVLGAASTLGGTGGTTYHYSN